MMHRMLRPARLLASTLSRFAAGLVLCGTLACAMTPERLPDLDRKFYYNLPTTEDKSAFLRLDETQRQPYLEKKGLWAKWSEMSNEERTAVQAGEVKVGQHEFAAFMVWGPPADSQVSKGERQVRFHTFIRCTSGPRIGKYVQNNLDCDGTSSEVEIAVEGGLITEIKFLN
jgi:hypothetical protein